MQPCNHPFVLDNCGLFCFPPFPCILIYIFSIFGALQLIVPPWLSQIRSSSTWLAWWFHSAFTLVPGNSVYQFEIRSQWSPFHSPKGSRPCTHPGSNCFGANIIAHITGLPSDVVNPNTVKWESFWALRVCCLDSDPTVSNFYPPIWPSFAWDVLLPTSSTNSNFPGCFNMYLVFIPNDFFSVATMWPLYWATPPCLTLLQFLPLPFPCMSRYTSVRSLYVYTSQPAYNRISLPSFPWLCGDHSFS